ncbi:hypothetical protein [Blastopirellula marina]|uniref:Uncharacterized protein n=1 Tax=Blastopirellula marina TaxID=124 RepID=A0A2S8F7X5_9BACT|nr:hypothetical protein [Blastopirellula marina]PQO28262.1 hypothetical protein C5Y98_25535 [Blastopirellula marina]PTL41802.1 hypothetical protein C5Y97_25550 [Blastopirellula marina]
MTKPLGSPKSQDQQDNHRTFYGHPIVVRVKDLTWEPPVEEEAPAQEAWVSNLLGEDPYEVEREESLLVNVPPAPELPFVEPPIAELPPTTIEPVASKPQPASKTPDYLNHSGDGRRERLQSLITGQWKNRIMMSGMAVSLFVATYWLLSSGGTDESPVDDVQQNLIVESGQLGDAPAWNAPSPDSETITIEPISRNTPQMASMPPREDIIGSPVQHTSQMELTAISAPDVDSPEVPNYAHENPAWSQNPASGVSAQQDSYSPSFGPASDNTQLPRQAAPSFDAGSVPMESPIPNFDNSSNTNDPQGGYQPSFQGNRPSYEETAPSYEAPAPSSAGRSQYSEPSGDYNTSPHWMKEGMQNSMPTGATAAMSQAPLPSIQNGPPQGAEMPQIEAATPFNPSQYASSPANSQPAPQSGYGFSFDHGSNMPPSPTASQEGIRAARLSGEIEPRFDSGIR